MFSDRPQRACAGHACRPALRWSRDAKAFAPRSDFDAELADAIAAAQPDWVVCAGYMRLLGDAFVERFRGRMLNIHPSLLPAYRGLRTHARALADGAAAHGASVHFVSPDLDGGAVIAQATVPVAARRHADALANACWRCEHPAAGGASWDWPWTGGSPNRATTVLLDGHPLLRPLSVDSAGLFVFPSQNALP